MKTPHLDNLINDLKSYDRNDMLSDNGRNQLNEYEAIKQALSLGAVSGSLHYDEKLIKDLWYKRNPCHEVNPNGEDMFFKSSFMVFEDYVREVSRNDR